MSETKSVYAAYSANTHLFGGNGPYVEEMYENYLANPGSVPDNWRDYFDALQHVPAVDGTDAKDIAHLPVINAFADRAKQGVTQVVRGADLLDNTPRQIFLQRTLGLPTPRYLHVPVVTNAATARAGSVTEAGSLDDGTPVAGTASVSGR